MSNTLRPPAADPSLIKARIRHERTYLHNGRDARAAGDSHKVLDLHVLPQVADDAGLLVGDVTKGSIDVHAVAEGHSVQVLRHEPAVGEARVLVGAVDLCVVCLW